MHDGQLQEHVGVSEHLAVPRFVVQVLRRRLFSSIGQSADDGGVDGGVGREPIRFHLAQASQSIQGSAALSQRVADDGVRLHAGVGGVPLVGPVQLEQRGHHVRLAQRAARRHHGAVGVGVQRQASHPRPPVQQHRARVHVQLVVRLHGRAEGHGSGGSLLHLDDFEHGVGEAEPPRPDAAGDEARARPLLREHAVRPEVLDQQLQRAPLLLPEQLQGQRVGRLLLQPELRLQQRPPVALEGKLLGLRVAAEASDELVGYPQLRDGVRQRRHRRRRHGLELIGAQVLGLEERRSAGPGAVEHEGRGLPPDRARGGVGLRRRSSRWMERRNRGPI